jgi:hypothetical protein
MLRVDEADDTIHSRVLPATTGAGEFISVVVQTPTAGKAT